MICCLYIDKEKSITLTLFSQFYTKNYINDRELGLDPTDKFYCDPGLLEFGSRFDDNTDPDFTHDSEFRIRRKKYFGS